MRGIWKPKTWAKGRLRAAGFSYIEMVISASLALVLLTSLFSLYFGAGRGAARAETRLSADREGRLIILRMVKDFRLAGLIALQDVDGDSDDIRTDVLGMPWSDSLRHDFEYGNTYTVFFTGDVDNDSITETVGYYRDSTTAELMQQVWKWSRPDRRWIGPETKMVAPNVDFLMFRYFDRDGASVPNPVVYPAGGDTLSVGERIRVTAVEIILVTRSERMENGRPPTLVMPDGKTWNDRFRRSEQRFLVRGRNLNLGA